MLSKMPSPIFVRGMNLLIQNRKSFSSIQKLRSAMSVFQAKGKEQRKAPIFSDSVCENDPTLAHSLGI